MSTKGQRDQEKIQRAESARQVLENPVYKAAMQAMRVEVYQQLGQVSPTDGEALQSLTLTLQSVDKFERILQNYYTKGKITLQNQEKLANSTNTI